MRFFLSNLWQKMNWNMRILLGILCGMFWVTFPGEAQGAGESVAEIFEDAQRYHMGLDRPVDYTRAFARYMDVVEADPKNKDAYYNMAHICVAQKRYDLAASYYQRVVDIDPQDSDAYNNLGTVYMRQGEQAKAKKAYAKAVQLNRNFAVAYYNLTFVFMKEGDKARAEMAIGEALRIEPDNPDFVKLQSQILGEVGKISDWWAVAAFGGFGGIIVGYYWLFARKGV